MLTNNTLSPLIATFLSSLLVEGYVPYGSSDILLPTLVAICWILELCPRYQGDPPLVPLSNLLEQRYSRDNSPINYGSNLFYST